MKGGSLSKHDKFKSFLRPVLENTANLVHLLSMVCEKEGFVFFSIL